MTWAQWAAATLIAVSTVVTITQTGKPREPLTPQVVAIAAVLNAFIFWALVTS